MLNTFVNRNHHFLLIAILLALIYFIVIMQFYAPAFSTPDAQSYYGQAGLLASHSTTTLRLENPLQYAGQHWYESEPNTFYCVHPPGLPAIIALFDFLFGFRAGFLVNPLMAALSLLGLYLFAEKITHHPGWSLFSMILMALSPIANEHALFGFSHAALAAFLCWGLYFLICWIEKPSWYFALLFGLCLGMIPTIRYAEGLLLFGAGIVVGFLIIRKHSKHRNSVLFAIMGLAIPLVPLLLRNQFAYGAFWRTGYSEHINQATFTLNYALQHAPLYLLKLLTEGNGAAFLLGVVGIVYLFRNPEQRLLGWLFLLSIIPTTLLYMSFWWPVDAQSLRFIMPTLYLYAAAAAISLHRLEKIKRTFAMIIAGIALIGSITIGLPASHVALSNLYQQNSIVDKTVRAIEAKIPHGNIIITNEALCQNLDYYGIWRLTPTAYFLLPTPPAIPPMRSTTGQEIRTPSRNERLAAKYRAIAPDKRFEAITLDAFQWTDQVGNSLYFAGLPEQIELFRWLLPLNDTLIVVDTIPLPATTMKMNHNKNIRPATIPFSPPFESHSLQIFDWQLDGRPIILAKCERIHH